MQHLPVLSFLKLQLSGELPEGATTHMKYPTAISRLLGIRIAQVDEAFAVVEIDASSERHGNQQGTVHGGLICELADAAIGTAHSTLMEQGESFASIELKVSFMRPVFQSTLRATARAINRGRTITHYQCDITRDDGKLAAVVTSSIMTLRGEQAEGR
jgi:uncharacterized protein (TIGR00369 family)